MNPSTTPPPEEPIWKGCPSPIRYFWLNLALLATTLAIVVMAAFNWQKPTMAWSISALLLAPLSVWLWKRVELRSRIYEITTQRVRLTQGIFARQTDELELYRVRDLTFVQPFVYRLLNRGDIRLTTTDATTPSLVLECLPADEDLRNRLRRAIETCRDRKRVRVAEMDLVDGSDSGVAEHS